jgi:4,5-DOPA dioxygenase extradiol
MPAAGVPARTLVDGYAYGSLSMTSYGVGCDCLDADAELTGSAPLSREVPADQSNV